MIHSFSFRTTFRKFPFFYMMLCLCLVSQNVSAQLTMPADGGSVNAMVKERVGLTDVTITYSRPAVRGREGKIWGEVIHEGFGDDKDNPMPWRAGANETTTIEFSTDVTVENHHIAAGKYGLFIAYYPVESVIILSNINNSWGSIFYDTAEDIARIKVKPVKLDKSAERLTYEFKDQDDSTATILLSWEKLGIPFRIKTSLHELQMATIEKESQTLKAFNPAFLLDAAEYMLDHNTDLEKALGYTNRASRSLPSFRSYMLQSAILRKLNQSKEADEALKQAVYYGNPAQVHYYAMGRLKQKEYELAMKVLQLNYDKNPGMYITNLGLAKGYIAQKDAKNAKKYIKAADKYAQSDSQKQEIASVTKEANSI